MVDPNPARGMPLPLQKYWLFGKGAAKIRWGMPHDFNRCVRNLRKYFPKNPEGLCNILHRKRLGAPPGKGHGDAHALLAAMPELGKHLWAGPLAPIGRPTGEPRRMRIFEHGALQHRELPLPLEWREKGGQGHEGSVTVGRILGITYGPNEAGLDYAYGWGDFLADDIIPDAAKARYLVQQGVAGTSVDPGGRVAVTVNPETGAEHVTEYTIGAATLVPIPAFSSMRIYTFTDEEDWPDDDLDMVMDLAESDGDCGCSNSYVSGEDTYSVNASGWQGLPLAARNAVFDKDDAVKRIAAWAGVNATGADVSKLQRAFLYHDPKLPPTDPTSYWLPLGDIINGKLTLIFHAIYAAAALISGAHGGLPNIPEEDKGHLRGVISSIYAEMAKSFNDSSIRAPWDRSAQEGVQMSVDTYATEAAKEPYGDVAYADPGYQDDKKKRYPIDTTDHVRAAWSYINQADNAGKYTPEQVKAIKARIQAAAKKHGVEIASQAASGDDYSMSEEGYPLTPPRAWFDDPKLPGKTPLTITASGRVYGHLAAWGECHRDVTMRECVLAPHSRQEYAPYHLGGVVTAEGDLVQVGKIVMDTRHADIRLGYSATVTHYDDTGAEVAVVRAGEDEYGIWLAGAVVPEATPQKVAKLRRSPLSGDWRRERGSLELTAALAVNAPAFPVYTLENDEQMALVAAGTIMPIHDEFVPPTGIAFTADDVDTVYQEVKRRLVEDEAKAERAQRLKDIQEDEEIFAQRRRAVRLAGVFAADPDAPTPAPAPAPAVASAPTPAGEPVPEPDPGATDLLIAQNADAQYSVVPEAGVEEPAPAAAAPAAPVAPVAPVPAPTAPPAPAV